MTRRSFALFAAAIAPLLTMIGCGTNQIIQALQLAVDAASVAIPIVAAATGVPAATVTLLMAYLQAVSTAIDGAVPILDGTGTPSQKAAAILALFASIKVPNLTGLPAAIVSAIQLVAQRVAEFLAHFAAPKLGAMGAKANQPAPVSTADHSKLQAIAAKAQANLAAIKAVKK